MYGPARGQGACVVIARGEAEHAFPEARDGHGREPVPRGAVTQLALLVTAPAVRGPAGGQSACEIKARGDGEYASLEARDGHGLGSIGVGAIPELALVVATPTVRGPARSHSARVVAARGEGEDAIAEARDGHGLIPGDCGAVPELPISVVAPAMHGPALGQGARVEVAQGDGAHRRACRDSPR